MFKIKKYCPHVLVLFVFIVAAPSQVLSEAKVLSEEGTVKIISPWKAKGKIYKVGPEQFRFIGEFGGIMYVDKGEQTLDAAILVCPAVQDIDYKTKTTKATGKCHIVAPEGNIFANFSCTGVPGACEGEFVLNGGTDRFNKISGSSKMVVRSALRSYVSENAASGEVIAEAEGIALWPSLQYKIPQ